MNTVNYANCQALIKANEAFSYLAMFIKKYSLLFFVISTLFCSFDLAAEGDVTPVKATLIAEEKAIQPGRPFWVAIRLQMADHWHSYWKNPGSIGFSPEVEWQLPEGFQASSIYWPYPERLESPVGVNYGYTKEVWLLTQITPAMSTEKEVKITSDLRWLVCSESTCLPASATLTLTLPIAQNAEPTIDTQWASYFNEARAKLPKKSPDLTASVKEKQIILSLPPDHPAITNQGAIVQSYFCPDNQEMIDDTVALLIQKPENSTDYQLILQAPETGEIAMASYPLKGTLVLNRGEGDGSLTTEAWEITAPLANESPAFTEENEFASGGIPLALLFAFMGGILLNLMPCVLPVISLKILSFVKMANQSRSKIFLHGLSFSSGVIVSFWILAGLLLVLQAYGRSAGWGFQLQEPLFVATLAAIILVVALNLFGLFEIGTLFSSWAGQTESQTLKRSQGLLSSFLSGVLATAVATPCTGPFLGSAIGYAMTLSAPEALLIFTFLGLGMASPYLFLSTFPALLRWVPKPGAWMITFKEIMGFLMLATALWLVWVFGVETSLLSVIFLLIGFLFLTIGCWIFGKWCGPSRKRGVRLIGYVITTLFCVAGVYTILQSTGPSNEISTSNDDGKDEAIALASVNGKKKKKHKWEAFSSTRLEELRKKGIPVIVNFTASWCLICQTNFIVLSTGDVNKKLDEMGVVRMEADWTKNDPTITKELRKFGRSGVPLYLLYGTEPSQPPEILPQLLTSDNVLSHLAKVEAQKIQNEKKKEHQKELEDLKRTDVFPEKLDKPF